jgi:hypothetical protein
MKQESRRQALWRKVGDAFATPGSHEAEYGLCEALYRISKRLSPPDWNDLEVSRLVDSQRFLYWLPARMDIYGRKRWLPEHDTARALFAYLMAELSDKEYAQIGGNNDLYKEVKI